MQRDVANEIIVAFVALLVIVIALVLGILLSLPFFIHACTNDIGKLNVTYFEATAVYGDLDEVRNRVLGAGGHGGEEVAGLLLGDRQGVTVGQDSLEPGGVNGVERRSDFDDDHCAGWCDGWRTVAATDSRRGVRDNRPEEDG